MTKTIPPGPFMPSPAFIDWLDSLPPPKLTPSHERALKWSRIHGRQRARFAVMKGLQAFAHRQQQNNTHWGTCK